MGEKSINDKYANKFSETEEMALNVTKKKTAIIANSDKNCQ